MDTIDRIAVLVAIAGLAAWFWWSKLARTIAVESLRRPRARTTIYRTDGDIRVEVAPDAKR